MGLNIDVEKVLSSKIDPVEESFNSLCISDNFADNVKFIHTLMRQPKNVIHENLSYLYKVPNGIGIKYFDGVIETANDLTSKQLTSLKDELNTFMTDSTLNEDIVEALKKSAKLIESKIEYHESMEAYKEEMQMKLFRDRIASEYACESYLDDDLAIIAYNINHNFEVIDDYEKVIRNIKMSDDAKYFSSYPMILENNTTIILNINRYVSGDVYQLLISLPKVLADKLMANKAPKKIINTMIKVYDKQIKRITTAAKNSHEYYSIRTNYLRELRDCRDALRKYLSTSVKEMYTIENITEMQPDIINYEPGVLEDIAGYTSEEFEAVEAELEDSMMEIFTADEDPNPVIFENFAKLADLYTAIYEAGGFNKDVTRASTKVASGSRKVANAATNTGKTISHVATATKYAVSPLTNKINEFIEKIKTMDKEERTNRIITGKIHLTLIGFLRKLLTLVAIGAVGSMAPNAVVGLALKIVTLLAAIAINKALDLRERKRIIMNLETELRIVQEKVDDAKSKGDTKAKYELMRLEDKLKKDINRVKYYLNT